MRKQICILGVCFVVFLLIFFMTRSTKEPIEMEPIITTQEEEFDQVSNHQEMVKFIVDVKGEVQFPGIYEVDETFRVYDVIQLAGGLTEDAQTDSVNFAKKVRDEMVIYIPNIHDEPMDLEDSNFEDGKNGTKISINYATLEELQTLPGIGAVKAQAIITYRTEVGPFEVIEDLTKVSGIGDKTLENLRDHIEV